MLRDALKMGAVGGRRLPRPGPRPERLRGGGARRSPPSSGCPVDLHTDGRRPGPAGPAGRDGRRAAARCHARALRTAWPRSARTRGPTAGRLAAAGVSVVCLPQGGCGGAGPRPASPARPPAAGGRGAGRRGQRRAARPGQPGRPRRPAGGRLPARLARRVRARRGRTTWSAARPGRCWGCPRSGWRRASRPSCSRCAASSLAGVLSLAYSRIVIHRGRVVSRTSAVREYCDSAGDRRPRPPAPGAPRGVASGYAHCHRRWTWADRAAAGAAAERSAGTARSGSSATPRRRTTCGPRRRTGRPGPGVGHGRAGGGGAGGRRRGGLRGGRGPRHGAERKRRRPRRGRAVRGRGRTGRGTALPGRLVHGRRRRRVRPDPSSRLPAGQGRGRRRGAGPDRRWTGRSCAPAR